MFIKMRVQEQNILKTESGFAPPFRSAPTIRFTLNSLLVFWSFYARIVSDESRSIILL